MTERPVQTGPGAMPRRRAAARRVAGRFGYSLLLFPRSVAGAGRALTGRTPDELSPGRALTRAGVGMVLGVVGLVELGLLALFVTRGVGYGFVDGGPYTDAWGGPTLAGAWVVHFVLALRLVVVVVAVGQLVTGLHSRVSDRLRGRPAPRWTLPATVGLSGLVALFVVAWTRQL